MFCSQCHQGLVAAPKRACVHISDPQTNLRDRHRRYTGEEVEYELVCTACATAAGATPPLLNLCPACFAALEQEFYIGGQSLGGLQIRERKTDLSFAHQIVRVQRRPLAPIAAVQPVAFESRPVWVLLTQSGELWRLDLEAASCDLLFQLPSGQLPLDQPLTLHLDRSGRFAAVANTFGLHGAVVDLQAAVITLALCRESYLEEHCIFPLAFFDYEGRPLLVHATAWNRLEVTDPASGEAHADRPVLRYDGPKPEPHYLDYFHSGLLVSPDQHWIADNGWIWHPVGAVATWNLTDWVARNRWESEDGPSRRVLCDRIGFWNGPLCWIGSSTLAVWGFGDDEQYMMPAVRLFDVATGQEKHWFAGPDGELVHDGVLYSYSPKAGTAVWDVETGERLLSDLDFCPTAYHPGAREFLSVLDDGSFRRTQLRNEGVVEPRRPETGPNSSGNA